ncbi:MAG: nucleoside phosphorylase [Clostridia bacterium]|nr:nucleoside phosphorylase [Clostridia bacterium]
MLLEEFDESREAVLQPSNFVQPLENMPETVVSCFERGTFERMLARYGGEQIALRAAANMEMPVYATTYQGKRLGLFLMDVGAPACAALCEELYQMGARTILLFGSCGVLDSRIGDCSIIVPHAALRDEGTSYHYLPPADEIAVNQAHLDAFTAMLDQWQVRYTVGKTWTTDGVYRETPAKIARRRAQGCVCVEMECAAAAAVAQFRGKDFFTFFFAADNLDAAEWDPRSLDNAANPTGKDKAAWLAMDFAAQLSR